jgi:hypothetical protein
VGSNNQNPEQQIRDRDVAGNCEPCTCTSGYYITGGMCHGNLSSSLFNNVDHCAPCNNCSMRWYSGTPCLNTLSDTQAPCQDCATCDVGKYESGICGTVLDTTCLDCKTCGVDGRKSTCTSVANGKSGVYNDATACVDCEWCPVGSFISNNCGSHNESAPNCTSCSTATCADGTYRTNCTGKGTLDSVCAKCVQCAGNSILVSNCSHGSELNVCSSCTDCSSVSATYDYGAFVSSTCLSHETTPICAGCQACTSGFYVQENCTGSGVSNQSTCAISQSCSVGEYITSSGNSYDASNRTCVPCNGCMVGMYRAGCNGTGTTPFSDCTECPLQCPYGQYRDDTLGAESCSCKSCDSCQLPDFDPNQPTGYRMKTCTNASSQTCTPCQTCRDGQYISQECTGTIVDDSTCTNCTSCQKNEIITNGCTGKERNSINVGCAVCGSCGFDEYITNCDGTTTNSTCKKCSDCGLLDGFGIMSTTEIGTTYPSFVSTRCLGNSTTQLSQNSRCTICQCPSTNPNQLYLVVNGDHRFIHITGACSSGYPDHECTSNMNGHYIVDYMRRIGLKSIATNISINVDVGTALQRKKLRRCIIDSQPVPQIQSILFDSLSLLNTNLRFWTVYETDEKAQQARAGFNFSTLREYCKDRYAFNIGLVSPPVIFNTNASDLSTLFTTPLPSPSTSPLPLPTTSPTAANFFEIMITVGIDRSTVDDAFKTAIEAVLSRVYGYPCTITVLDPAPTRRLLVTLSTIELRVSVQIPPELVNSLISSISNPEAMILLSGEIQKSGVLLTVYTFSYTNAQGEVFVTLNDASIPNSCYRPQPLCTIIIGIMLVFIHILGIFEECSLDDQLVS